KNEALEVLKRGSALDIDPAQYAACVVKLETALDELEASGKGESELAQEVSSALYWARKFATLEHIEKIRTAEGRQAPREAKPAEARKPAEPAPDPETPALPGGPDFARQEAAKKKFEAGEAFARAHAADDYAIGLRWFQVSEETAGTDYALKALALAREAQKRYATQQLAKGGDPIDGDPIDGPRKPALPENFTAAQALADAGKHAEAVAGFERLARTDSGAAVQRALARAYFSRAQQMKEELLPRYEAMAKEWKDAVAQSTKTVRTVGGRSYKKFDPNAPAMREVQAKAAALTKAGQEAIGFYEKAAGAFRRVLDASPGKQDLEAAASIALCSSVRGDPYARMRARKELAGFLDEYKPKNDGERTLYEFCKSELARIDAK
ncbi:MAG: hypothetical protein M5U26_30785, partial [Planctomycetota bacterium]|nr:hypothetical protein [Planctomycetota bacterium]